ncbi:MAG: PrsW family intramembrane metalloprotease [Spirochaetia bacterium]|nr:PrsW family intramembrane metalloprotease [Spirochaetia bacterium]
MILYGAAFFGTSLFFLWLFSRSGGLKPATVIVVFAAGILAGPICGMAEVFFETQVLSGPEMQHPGLRAFALYMFGVGPIEEVGKFLAVFLIALQRADFKNSSDGILLAICSALGFAAGENLIYMANFGPVATLPRLILGNLGHASFSAYWGYALGVALHENARLTIVIEGLLLAAVLHGVYDLLLTFSIPGAIGAMLLAGLLMVLLVGFFRREGARHKLPLKKQK